MTIPNQLPQNDPRRPSVPTSSLPLVGSSYGHHHRIGNLSSPHQPNSSYNTSYQPPVSTVSTSNTNGNNNYSSLMARSGGVGGGLVSVNTSHNTILSSPTSNPLKSLHHPYDQRTEHENNNPTSIQSGSEHSPSSPASGCRPLNVSDALQYLDEVKARFADKLTVYNQFLDIMKDFKSQSIDTPGVIERVSTLFKGHPLLISGFNTFLPVGYRIDFAVDQRDPNRIIVTTPNGNKTTSTTSTAEEMLNMDLGHHHQRMQQRQGDPYYPSHSYHPPAPPAPPPIGSMHPSPISQPSHRPLPPPPPSHHPTSSAQRSSSYNTTSNSSSPYHNTPNSTFLPPPPPSSVPPTSPISERRPPVEFNHAINYVNRIKNRFAHNPDIYKQFLEILQTYQKEQKPIGEVYSHVQFLFNGADDLLEEFKQFLPEITLQQPSPPSQPNKYGNGIKRHTSMHSNSSACSAMPSTKKKKASTKKSKLYTNAVENSTISHEQEEPVLRFTSTFDPLRPSVAVEEVELFEQIKKYIGNRPSYEEFLKTLNLYTQHIIDIDLLVSLVKAFLGTNKELFDAFKMAISYEPKEHPIVRPTLFTAKPDLAHCTAVDSSPSYRVVPKDWQNQPCSGRDQLCWEVLNDEYVSHPIWASEDSGFVASKKNSYEEALHRCEEERYDYDLNIEANLNTIALLKPIALQIQQMTPEERENMRLKEGLGGLTKSIYERIIKKVYDDERGAEVIKMLYENPAVTVPIVLNRLEVKDKEWKKAQKEWNKVWREQDDKNYYRALDYQSNTFKANDKKAITTKALISEIEALLQKSDSVLHYQFEFTDLSIFDDIIRLVISYMDRQNGFTKSDKQKIKQFMRGFVPMFFSANRDRSPSSTGSVQGNSDHEEDSTSDVDMSAHSGSPSHRAPSSGEDEVPNHHKNGKLLRGVLIKNGTPTTDSPKLKANDTKAEDEEMEEVMEEIAVDQVVIPDNDDDSSQVEEGMKLFAAAAAVTAPDQDNMFYQTRNYSFLCNSHYYCLFRMYQVLYERLFKMKTFSDQVKANPALGKKFNSIAVELDLVSNRFDDIDLSNGYYDALLNIIDHFFEGEMESSSFEENVRYVFGINAYMMFTVDKLVQALIKQIQQITVDKKSKELIKLFCRNQTTPRNILVYRSNVEKVLGSDENLYKITFDIDNHTTSIQLLNRENESLLTSTEQELYEEYMASYIDWMHDTKGVDRSFLKPTFLNRNLRPQVKHLERINVRSQLRYKVQQKTYHMYYIVGSEDVLYRVRTEDHKEANSNIWAMWLTKQGNDHLNEDTRKLLN